MQLLYFAHEQLGVKEQPRRKCNYCTSHMNNWELRSNLGGKVGKRWENVGKMGKGRKAGRKLRAPQNRGLFRVHSQFCKQPTTGSNLDFPPSSLSISSCCSQLSLMCPSHSSQRNTVSKAILIYTYKELSI